MSEGDGNGGGSQLSMPPQISRLLMVAGAGLVLFLMARYFLVPSSFGEYGWYRGDALKEASARPISFAGKKSCLECHDTVATAMQKSAHRTFSCESCHGANAAHADDPNTETQKIEDPLFCLRCHEANPSRPAKFPQVSRKDHYSDGSCMDCHQPHHPTEAPSK